MHIVAVLCPFIVSSGCSSSSPVKYSIPPTATSDYAGIGTRTRLLKKRCKPGLGVSGPEIDRTRVFAPAGQRGTWRG